MDVNLALGESTVKTFTTSEEFASQFLAKHDPREFNVATLKFHVNFCCGAVPIPLAKAGRYGAGGPDDDSVSQYQRKIGDHTINLFLLEKKPEEDETSK